MSPATHIAVRVPLNIRRQPGRRTIVLPHGAPVNVSIRTRADPAMLKALARAFRWRRMLEDGRYASISKIATAEKIDRGYVGSILRSTLLAPDVVQGILDGQQPQGVALSGLLKPFSADWVSQRAEIWTWAG